jgi:hypothetical protein
MKTDSPVKHDPAVGIALAAAFALFVLIALSLVL